MSYRIICKTTNNVIGVVENNDEEFIDELIKANDGNKDDYMVEEFTEIQPTPEEQNEQQRQAILKQLAELDIIVPSIIEYIIAQGDFIIPQNQLDIISQKQVLRQQLNELEA